MDALLVSLSTDDGRLIVWGVFTRLFALTLAIILIGFSYQLPALSGRRGLAPLCDALARYRRDFGVVRAAWYWPTLFWVTGSSDFALRAVPGVGAFAALCAVWGGAWASPVGLAVAWATLLSVDAGPFPCVYPWDSLALEASFLALWLPGTRSLSQEAGGGGGGIGALALPPPLLAFAFRWLLFRVLVGFGKLKFVGAGANDRFYIRGFLIGQPIVSPAGWFAYHALPEFAWIALSAGMFVTELIIPFGLFIPGMPRIIAAVSIAGLMAGIQLTGNFGYFNLLTAILCLPGLDATSALTLPDLSKPVTPHALAFALLFAIYMAPASLLQFVMNSWINMSWAHWSGVYRLRLPAWLAWTQLYARALRELGHLRIVSAYGVFLPSAFPAQRWALCYEGSAGDGAPWQRYELHYYISSAKTKPAFVAPWHPRIDHAIFYESFGGSGSPMAVLGHNNPYSFHVSANAYVRLQLRLLEGGDAARAIKSFFCVNPFPDAAKPPRKVRVVVAQFLPASLEHWRRTGDWWVETSMGVAHAAVSLESLRSAQLNPKAPLPPNLDDAWPLNDSAPSPEDFWVECLNWRQRAGRSAGSILAADIAKAFKFVEDLRVAAARTVLELCAIGEVAATPAPKDTVTTDAFLAPAPRAPSSKLRSRGGTIADGIAAMPTAASTAVNSQRRDISEPVTVTHSKSFVRLPFGRGASSTKAAAERVLIAARSGAEIARADADAVFIWAALPGTVARLRAGRTMAALTQIRSHLSRLSAPLMRGAARVFDRPTPTAAELAAELDACVTQNISPGARASWLHVGDMVATSPPDACAAVSAAAGLPLVGADGGALFHFDGNDDAGAAGAMRNPLRWLMHAHRVMLEGGPNAWKTGVARLGSAPLPGERVRLDLLVGDKLHAMPRPAVYDALCNNGRFDPSHMPTEAGSFLLWALDYDALSASATAFHRVASQSRPPSAARPVANPTFLPAMLDMVPRIHAHPELRAAHVPHADKGEAGFQALPKVPGWCLSQDGATWTPSGSLHQ